MLYGPIPVYPSFLYKSHSILHSKSAPQIQGAVDFSHILPRKDRTLETAKQLILPFSHFRLSPSHGTHGLYLVDLGHRHTVHLGGDCGLGPSGVDCSQALGSSRYLQHSRSRKRNGQTSHGIVHIHHIRHRYGEKPKPMEDGAWKSLVSQREWKRRLFILVTPFS